MYNKEAMRKLLEDCWRAGCNAMLYDLGHTATKPPDRNTFITNRLAALDDGPDLEAIQKECDKVLTQESVDEYIKEHPELFNKKVDDGQEGNGLNDAIDFGDYLLSRLNEMCEVVDDETGKSIWECDDRKEYTTEQLYKIYKSEYPNPPLALPVADGGKVEAGFIKYLVHARNDFVKTVVELYPHEVSQPDKPERIKMRVACENIIIAYDQMKHKFTSILPSAVTGGVKWVRVSDRLPEIPPKYYDKDNECAVTPCNINVLVWDGENVYEKSFGIIDWDKDITYWMPLPHPPSEPEQGGKPNEKYREPGERNQF